MMKDKMARFLKIVFLVPLFILVTLLWLPFALLFRVWMMSASDINDFFTPTPKGTNIIRLKEKNSRWH